MAKKGTTLLGTPLIKLSMNIANPYPQLAKSRTIAVRLISMALTGYYKTLIRPRTHRPLSMLKYDPVGMLYILSFFQGFLGNTILIWNGPIPFVRPEDRSDTCSSLEGTFLVCQML
jgi:hypothetical protein